MSKIGVAVKDVSHKLLQVATHISKHNSGLGVIQGILVYLYKNHTEQSNMLTNYDQLSLFYGQINQRQIFSYQIQVLKVIDKSHSKPGKHGPAKIKLVRVDYFIEKSK